MKKMLPLLIFLVTASLMLAQSTEQQEWLRNFSYQQSILWNKGRLEAESLAVKLNLPVRMEYPDGTVIEIQGIQDGVPYYHMTDNTGSAKTISADKVITDNSLGIFSLNGSGQVIGLWEAGGIPRATHQELINRATLRDNGGSATQHATHTAGTLIASGVSPNAKGMSIAGQIDYYNSSNDLSELSAAGANGLRVSSHSYGQITGWRYNYFNDNRWVWFGNPAISQTEDYRFGLYTSTSQSWDLMLTNAPNLLVVKSAGNDRGEGPSPGTAHYVNPDNTVLYNTVRDYDGGVFGYDCINDPKGIAKNTLTVGAVNKVSDYTNPGSVVMSSFSGWGPTDDGRIKPDIVAAGVSLYSSSHESNTSYASLSGTSMATPSVAGSVGLLLQLQQELHGTTPLRSSTLKGLILHTADEAGQHPGPDYVYGWGLMNTFNAALMMKINKETIGAPFIKEELLNNGGQYQLQVQSNGTEPLKVTICWIDPPGTPPAASLNPPTIMLKNDLDIRITGPNATTFSPWVLDPANPSIAATRGDNIRDNVEQILIDNPVAGTYTITVTHKGTLVNNSQLFSLILSGNVIPVPNSVTLIAPANGATDVPINATLQWSIAERASRYEVQISTDNAFNTITYQNSKVQGVNLTLTSVLQGLQQYFWRVRAVNSGGNSAWSEVRSFSTVVSIPPAPVLYAPTSNSLNAPIEPVLSWSGSSLAERYWLRVSKNTLFTNIVFSDSTITDSSYTLDSLQEQQKYYWRVNAINSGGSSNSSAVNNFTTGLFAPSNLIATVLPANHVSLTWQDNSALETKFYILRKPSGGVYQILDSVLAANSTGYADTLPLAGPAYYTIYAANNVAASDSSNEALATIVSVNDGIHSGVPKQFVLSQNYPNPFNPATEISFALPWESHVKLMIYNALGEEVEELVNNTIKAGYYNFSWNAARLSSGTYFYSITAVSPEGNNITLTKKMLLIK